VQAPLATNDVQARRAEQRVELDAGVGVRCKQQRLRDDVVEATSRRADDEDAPRRELDGRVEREREVARVLVGRIRVDPRPLRAQSA